MTTAAPLSFLPLPGQHGIRDPSEDQDVRCATHGAEVGGAVVGAGAGRERLHEFTWVFDEWCWLVSKFVVV